MSTKQEEEAIALNDRLQNMLNNLSRCKINFINRNEECKRLRDANSKLEVELKEVCDLEKSYSYHLEISREMINNLQETISQLVYVKRDVKTLKDKISSKEAYLLEMEKAKENSLKKQNEKTLNIRAVYEKQIGELKANSTMQIQQKQHECDTQIALATCDVEELKAKMRDMESENRERINIVVLEYEEKLQREAVQLAQLQEQLSRETARSDLNITAYRRRLEDVEEKLKQSQFQQYLQNVYSSPYGSHAETPQPVTHGYQEYSLTVNSNQEKAKTPLPKPLKSANPLQIIYHSNKTEKAKPSDKKHSLHPTKKRKLFNANEFLD